jgi:hypothetical protein
MRRLVLLAMMLSAFAGCGGSDSGGSPSSPSTPTTPTTPTVTVTGVNVTGAGCGGSTCTITTVGGTVQLTAMATKSDNSTQDVTSLATWSSTNTAIVTVSSSGLVTVKKGGACDVTAVYQGKMGGQTIDAAVPLWSKSGKGDTVFDMPTYISRVHITGTYTGYSQNFIVHIGTQHAVNVILGTSQYADGTTYDGTVLTSGGVVEIVSSSGVSWSFTEVR